MHACAAVGGSICLSAAAGPAASSWAGPGRPTGLPAEPSLRALPGRPDSTLARPCSSGSPLLPGGDRPGDSGPESRRLPGGRPEAVRRSPSLPDSTRLGAPCSGSSCSPMREPSWHRARQLQSQWALQGGAAGSCGEVEPAAISLLLPTGRSSLQSQEWTAHQAIRAGSCKAPCQLRGRDTPQRLGRQAEAAAVHPQAAALPLHRRWLQEHLRMTMLWLQTNLKWTAGAVQPPWQVTAQWWLHLAAAA